MTEIYKTPKHLHIQECDSDGNIRTVKYYREDIINDFVVRIARDLQRIQDEADEPQRGCDADCNEDCIECAKETELWKAEQTDCSWK